MFFAMQTTEPAWAPSLNPSSAVKVATSGKAITRWDSAFATRFIPSDCSEAAYKDVRKVSPHSELHILNGREHDIVLGNDEDLTLNFLSKHTRCTFP